MQINDNQEVLLAVAWTTDMEINMLLRCPEILTMDVTEKKERCGLFMVVEKDGNGSIFTAMHYCFMPNAHLESLHWIYIHEASHLWPHDIRCDIQCNIS
jgi:hypothetical protein